MNRKQRRAADASAEWFQIDGKRDYGAAREELAEDALCILVDVFRSHAPTLPHSDEEIFNACMRLIRHGYLNVFVRFTTKGVMSRVDLLMPGIGTFEDYMNRSIQ